MDETQVVVFAAVVAAVAAVLASAVGAGGAILAQFLTVRATDKASAKRFEWEQKQAIRREKAERDARFAQTKRELFAKYLAIYSEYRLRVLSANYDEPGARVEKVDEAFEKFANEVIEVQSEIALVAPPLTVATAELIVMAGEVYADFRKTWQRDDVPEPMDSAGELNRRFALIEDCREAMAAHLHGEPITEP